MATGRGQFLLSLRKGLERIRPSGHGENSRGNWRKKAVLDSSRRCQDERTKPTASRQSSGCTAQCEPLSGSSLCRVNYFERLPPEIILKIFSYLDASSLFSASFVNRQFHRLANDSVVWYELYKRKMDRRNWRPRLCKAPVSEDVQDLPVAVWKNLLFSEMGCRHNAAWKKELRHLNLNTGMPEQTRQILRSLRVVWEITLTLKRGKQSTFHPSRTLFLNSSVTLCWSGGAWPNIYSVYSIELSGVVGFPTATTTRPQWRSLISKTVVNSVRKWRFIGTDSLVKLIQFDEGITVGVWRGTWTIAFVVATLHFHKLVEISVLGSLFCPYRPDELSPLHSGVPPGASVHGYTVLMLLNNCVRPIMQYRYSPVLCTREKPHGEFVWLRPVHAGLPQKPTPILGKISFPWKAGRLHGDIENCCVITVSVLDEAKRPVWCVSSTAALLLGHAHKASHTYDDEQLMLSHRDTNGKLRVTLVWMHDLQLYFLMDLSIRIRMRKVQQPL